MIFIFNIHIDGPLHYKDVIPIFLMGKSAGDIAFYAYIVPFLISTAVGSIIAGVLVYSLQRSGALRSMQNSLS